MKRRVRTRLVDGGLVEMTPSEIRADLVTSSDLGARRAKAAPLGDAEIDHLVDSFTLEATFRLAEVPGVPITSVQRSRDCAGLGAGV